MADMVRVRAIWTGTGVTGTGVSTFYSMGAALDARAAVSAFFTAVAGILPPTVTVSVPGEGEILDDVTGDVTGAWAANPGTSHAGTGAGAFARGVGMRVVWGTNGITNGRRVRGSTFLVPIGSSNYENDGSIVAGALTAVSTAASAMRTSLGGDFVIWRRPKPGVAGGTSSVLSSTVPDKVAWLTTRKN